MKNISSSPTITNCTLSGNSKTGGGGEIRNREPSVPTITNSIFWNNTAPNGPEIYNYDTSNPKITYCDIHGEFEGKGNVNSDQHFVDPSKNDLHVKSTSPGIDKGNNSTLGIPKIDFEGEKRIIDNNNDVTAKLILVQMNMLTPIAMEFQII